MRMITAFRHAVFHNYARFDGRMSRAEFWWFTLANFLIVMLYALFAGFIGAFSAGENSVLGGLVIAIYAIYMLALLLPNLAAQARRLHDAGLSAWLLLLNLLPYIGGLILLILYIFPARATGEKYGPYYDNVTP